VLVGLDVANACSISDLRRRHIFRLADGNNLVKQRVVEADQDHHEVARR